MDGSRWMTLAQAARQLGISPEHVRRLALRRVLTSRREGRKWLVDAWTVTAYERSTETTAIGLPYRLPSSGQSQAEDELWPARRGARP